MGLGDYMIEHIRAECINAGLPPDSKLCEICMGNVFDNEKTDKFRAIWGLPPLYGDKQDVIINKINISKKTDTYIDKPPVNKTFEVKHTKSKKGGGGCGSCGGKKSNIEIVKQIEPNGYGPGSQLLNLWKDMPHCDACYALAAEMDAWGINGCRQRFDFIVMDILPRAKIWMETNQSFAHRILSITSTEDVILKIAISRQVEKCIKLAEKLLKPISKSNILAAIIPFYNYMQSDSRLKNYYRCMEHLKDRGFATYVVEAALSPDKFQIPKGDVYAQFVIKDPLFIKESLVNSVYSTIPRNYDNIAWLDSDFIFNRPDIVDATIQSLNKWPIVQMFKTIEWLDSNGQPEPGRRHNYAGIGYRTVIKKGAKFFGRWPGGAWAAKREMLDKIGGLYDCYPAGSCDVLVLGALLGITDKRYFGRYSDSTMKHYMEWHNNTYKIVRGNIGYVDTVAFHLYHGTLKDRNYSLRHQKLKQYNFDPTLHLERNSDGINQLSQECPPEIREWISSYMLEMRNEP